MNKSTIKRALEVQEMVARYYEPGRQDRCKLWVYRNHVFPAYNISKSSFFRYLQMGKMNSEQ
jgi:hypothetical protein